MNEMLRVLGAILALALLSAGGANASERTRVEGAIPPVEGVVSPLRPEAVPEAGRELKLGYSGRGADGAPRHVCRRSSGPSARRRRPGRGARFRSHFTATCRRSFRATCRARLEWTPLGAGETIAAAMSVTSPGATDMRMGVLVDLAPGGELRFFGADAGRRFSVFTREDLAWEGGKPQTLWSAGGGRRYHRGRDHPAVPGRAVRLLVPRGPDLPRLRRRAARPGARVRARGSGVPRLPSRLPMRSGTTFFPTSRETVRYACAMRSPTRGLSAPGPC